MSISHIPSTDHAPVIHSKLGAGRRVAIPADWCQHHHLHPGDPVVLESTERGITIRSYGEVLREIQEFFRDDAPREMLLSDELIAERRQEAAKELREMDARDGSRS